MRPKNPVNLTGFFELWLGLFQSTILGRIPYVNVDISHKAFPTEATLIAVIEEVCADYRSRGRVNLNAALDYNATSNLTNHLRGLDIGYKMPGSGVTKAYKFHSLKDPASKQTFDLDGKKVTVEQYFRSRGHPLKYPHLPCISTMNNAFFPVEFCFVIGGQVQQ